MTGSVPILRDLTPGFVVSAAGSLRLAYVVGISTVVGTVSTPVGTTANERRPDGQMVHRLGQIAAGTADIQPDRPRSARPGADSTGSFAERATVMDTRIDGPHSDRCAIEQDLDAVTVHAALAQ